MYIYILYVYAYKYTIHLTCTCFYIYITYMAHTHTQSPTNSAMCCCKGFFLTSNHASLVHFLLVMGQGSRNLYKSKHPS